MSQYIGRTISLISSKGIRYNGTLREINGDEATVTLTNVRSLGTQGRAAAANNGDMSLEVPPSDNVYLEVVFRGSDVVDLAVLEDEEDSEAKKQEKPVEKPAQQEEEVLSQPRRLQPQQQASNKNSTTDEPVYRANQQPQYQQRQQRQSNNHNSNSNSNNNNSNYNQRRQYGNNNYQRRPNAFNAAIPDTEFQFDTAATSLPPLASKSVIVDSESIKNEDDETKDKDSDAEDNDEKKKDIQLEEEFSDLTIGKYDKKSSFFDTISSSTTIERPTPREQNNYGDNGFGANFGNNNNRNRGNYRGRGNGRGRGRGGWNNGNSWRGGYKSQFADRDD